MKMKKICYTNTDGILCIVHPVAKEDIERVIGEMTDEEYINHIYDRSIPSDALNVREIDDIEIPNGRYFRNAWKDTGKIEVDLPKARNLHMDNLRVIRNKMLYDLDVQYLKALELKDGTDAQIAAQKQLLRNMPQDYPLDNISDLDELKNYIPAILL